jgi:hypothetical protein
LIFAKKSPGFFLQTGQSGTLCLVRLKVHTEKRDFKQKIDDER